MDFFEKTLLITGGTGSFGYTVADKFLDSSLAEIRIFSRDEKKQDDMRQFFQKQRPNSAKKLKFFIGDVRDATSVSDAVLGANYIFHAAALKQVPSCEFFPMEAVKTNVVGTSNILTAATKSDVNKVICLSTDKAAYPINAMGISKAMMEKVAIAKARTDKKASTSICVTRYGNVLCSRGSVVPLFVKQAREGKPLTITSGDMTRFIMSLDEAVDLVSFAFDNARNGDLLVQKAPACTVNVLAQAISELFNVPHRVEIIGVRHGEKYHETLLTQDESSKANDLGNYFRVPLDSRDLNSVSYFEQGKSDRNAFAEFNSTNTEQLSVEQVKVRLEKLPEIQAELDGKIAFF